MLLGFEVTGPGVRVTQLVAVLRNQEIVKNRWNGLLKDFSAIIDDACPDNGIVQVDCLLDNVPNARPDHRVTAEKQEVG
jgi:hypothetical protein